jgi:hypothetical protein
VRVFPDINYISRSRFTRKSQLSTYFLNAMQ